MKKSALNLQNTLIIKIYYENIKSKTDIRNLPVYDSDCFNSTII